MAQKVVTTGSIKEGTTYLVVGMAPLSIDGVLRVRADMCEDLELSAKDVDFHFCGDNREVVTSKMLFVDWLVNRGFGVEAVKHVVLH